MAKKTVDYRIPALIRNGLLEKKRSFFVIVGDHAKDTLVHRKFSPTVGTGSAEVKN